MTLTTTTYDAEGYNLDGYCSYGYDRLGFYTNGWNISGIHRNGTEHDDWGFSKRGIHKDTGGRTDFSGETIYDKIAGGHEFSAEPSDADRLDDAGFDVDGIHSITGGEYSPDGRDVFGLDRDGFDDEDFYADFYRETGRSPDYQLGWHRLTRTPYGPDGFDFGGVDEFERDSTGRQWDFD